MIGDNYRQISPFDRWVFDASGNLAGASVSNRSDKEARFLTAEQAAEVQSLVSGAGILGPSYIEAQLPSPVGNARSVINRSEIGPAGAGSLWISDNVYWRTLNGRTMLVSGRAGAPGAALATATAIGKMSLPTGGMVSAAGVIPMPSGLLRVGTGLRVSAFIRHTGTAGTFSAAFRLGTANASSDPSICQVSGSASNDVAGWTFQEANITSATAFVTGFALAPNGAVGNAIVRNTQFDVAQQLYLGLYCGAVTAPDTVELLSYEIEFVD